MGYLESLKGAEEIHDHPVLSIPAFQTDTWVSICPHRVLYTEKRKTAVLNGGEGINRRFRIWLA
jgi:hypothetical protein